jgi:hypothetical protein
MGHRNPKSGTGDGAGFNRLRAAQALRMQFTALIQASHPSAGIYIDQVREYAGAQIVFYRAATERYEYARCAIFTPNRDGGYTKSSDSIVSQA